MSDVDVRVSLSQHDMRDLAEDRARRLVLAGTFKILTRARAFCPTRTGRLARSLEMRIIRERDGVRGQVFTRLHYAKFVHDGTRPHQIRPHKPGGVLRFASPAGSHNIVFARHVNHPGTRAQPFLRRAVESVAAETQFRLR